MVAYVDLNTLHNPSSGTAPPATWGDQARDNDEYLYQRGPYICTSATRPGSPFHGQVIYETDTFELLEYYSAAAVWRRPWKMPWGIIDYVTITAGTASFTTLADITGLTSTKTYTGNRRIKITGFLPRVQNVTSDNDAAFIYIRESTTKLATSFVFEGTKTSSGGGQHAIVSAVITPTAASHTYVISAERNSGANTHLIGDSSTAPAWLLIEDIGPNGNPA